MATLEIMVGGQPHRVDIPAGTRPSPADIDSIAKRIAETQGAAQDAQGAARGGTKTTPAAVSATPPTPPAPGFFSALGTAVKERTVDPALAVVAPSSTMGERLGGAATVAGTTLAPALAAFGALTQAGMESVGGGPDAARLIGGLAELGGGAAKLVGTGVKAAFAGKALAKAAGREAAALAGPGDFLPAERLATGLANEARSVFRAKAAPIKATFNAVEKVAGELPPIQPGTGAYGHLEDALLFAHESGFQADAHSMKLIKEVSSRVQKGQPVPVDRLSKLRKTLSRPTAARHADDPNVSMHAKLASSLRSRITDAFETALPPDVAEKFSTARRAYSSEIMEPKRALRTILNRNTTASKAFSSVFESKDPNALRTLMRMTPHSPAMRGKLRLGFLEQMRDATGDFKDTKGVLAAFEKSRPMLEHAKLFSRDELDGLHVFLRKRGIEKVSSRMLTLGTATRLAAGAGSGYLYSQDPTTIAMGAIAAGAMPHLSRLVMLPTGSTAGRQLAASALTQVGKLGRALASEETLDPSEVDEDSGD